MDRVQDVFQFGIVVFYCLQVGIIVIAINIIINIVIVIIIIMVMVIMVT